MLSTNTPGFTIAEIYHAWDIGEKIAAVKMLRAESGCSLKETADALRDRTADKLPAFAEREAERHIRDAAPELLTARGQ